jgi:hypothetical protein
MDGTRTCSRDAAGVVRLELETGHADKTERSERVAGWTGLEPGSRRRGNRPTACELWPQRIDGQLIMPMKRVRSFPAGSSRIDRARGDILETAKS